jgi:uncharacterized protein DUF955
MSPRLRDHKVKSRTEANIEKEAEYFRYTTRSSHDSAFNIADAVRHICRFDPYCWGGLEIKFQSAASPSPAFAVLGNQRELWVQYDIWQEAEEGDPSARFIVAHELGHLILHDHYAQPFSGIKSKWITFDEESGEWQANKFADHALVLARDINSFITPRSIAINCGVEYEVARRRLGKKLSLSGESCPHCGGLTMVRNGTCQICDTCGTSICS